MESVSRLGISSSDELLLRHGVHKSFGSLSAVTFTFDPKI